MNKHAVFVYGTLKRGGSNHYLLASARFVGEATTYGDYYSMYDGGFPCVLKDGISHVKGEVFLCDDETVARLDRLEGVPHHFMRHDATVVVSDGYEAEQYDCFMYVASNETAVYYKERGTPIIPNDSNVLEWTRQWKKAS